MYRHVKADRHMIGLWVKSTGTGQAQWVYMQTERERKTEREGERSAGV